MSGPRETAAVPAAAGSGPPQLLDRVTPSAALLLPPGADHDDPAVREVRRKGIHGSDVAAIVGATKRGSARTVWHEKHDGVHVDLPELAEAALWGRLLEPVVADEWARRHGLDPGRLVDVGTVVNVDQPWMRAQVDRLLYACPDMTGAEADALDDLDPDRAVPTCSLEIKCRSAYVASRWVDDIPDDVLAQVAWQRMVTGLDHIHIACLIGGNRPVFHRYDPDPELEQLLAAECGALWDRVLAHDPPDLDYSEVIDDVLAKLFPDRSGERELSPTEYGELLGPWSIWRAAAETAGEAKMLARGRVLEALAGHEVLTYQGEPVFTYKQVKEHTVPEHRKAAYRQLRGPQ